MSGRRSPLQPAQAAVRAAIAVALLLAIAAAAGARTLNGFNLDDTSVPAAEILHGGPPRDGIPAIDEPLFGTAGEATFLAPDDRVLGVLIQGIPRAYPVAVLNWHEVVNDRFGRTPVLITWCPLCGTGMAFSAVVDGRTLTFGVSGLLYNSDVLLYDRETETLWSQIATDAVAGPLKGKRLTPLTTANTTWRDWRARHPNTRVLMPDTGSGRDYSVNPYARYEKSDELMFRVSHTDYRLHPKERVIGLSLNGAHKAWPLNALRDAGTTVTDAIGGLTVRIVYDELSNSARAYDEAGNELPVLSAFWFAWYAFHPETQLYLPSEKGSRP